MSPPAAFDGVTSRVHGTRPTLRRPHDDHRPSGLGDGLAGPGGLLNLADLLDCPLHRSGHVVVDADIVLVVGPLFGQGSVLDDPDLIPVSSEEASELSNVSCANRAQVRAIDDTHLEVVHGSGDGPLANLVSVGVQDGDDRTALCRVDVLYHQRQLGRSPLNIARNRDRKTDLVCVPGGGSGTSLALAITNDSHGDHVGLVHDGSVRNSEAVSELSTFVDCTWGLHAVQQCFPSSYSTVGWERTSALTCEGKPPGILKALTNASIPSADIEYSG